MGRDQAFRTSHSPLAFRHAVRLPRLTSPFAGFATTSIWRHCLPAWAPVFGLYTGPGVTCPDAPVDGLDHALAWPARLLASASWLVVPARCLSSVERPSPSSPPSHPPRTASPTMAAARPTPEPICDPTSTPIAAPAIVLTCLLVGSFPPAHAASATHAATVMDNFRTIKTLPKAAPRRFAQPSRHLILSTSYSVRHIWRARAFPPAKLSKAGTSRRVGIG